MSKIQLNLLPDIKLEFNKAQHAKRLALSIAFLACSISLTIFILLILTVDVVQKQQLKTTGQNVDDASKKLQGVPQINQIITVQNQLQTLTQLHQSKHITSRVYTYLSQLTPSTVSVNKLDLDLKANTITISGKAPAQSDVNSFIDAIKTATYTLDNGKTTKPAFSSVVQSAFTINGNGVSYTINAQFDPALFANSVDSKGNPTTPTLEVKQQNTGSGANLFNSGGG